MAAKVHCLAFTAGWECMKLSGCIMLLLDTGAYMLPVYICYRYYIWTGVHCAQVARIQQQVLDALKQASQSNPAVRDAIARLNSQLFDISVVRYVVLCFVDECGSELLALTTKAATSRIRMRLKPETGENT